MPGTFCSVLIRFLNSSDGILTPTTWSHLLFDVETDSEEVCQEESNCLNHTLPHGAAPNGLEGKGRNSNDGPEQRDKTQSRKKESPLTDKKTSFSARWQGPRATLQRRRRQLIGNINPRGNACFRIAATAMEDQPARSVVSAIERNRDPFSLRCERFSPRCRSSCRSCLC